MIQKVSFFVTACFLHFLICEGIAQDNCQKAINIYSNFVLFKGQVHPEVVSRDDSNFEFTGLSLDYSKGGNRRYKSQSRFEILIYPRKEVHPTDVVKEFTFHLRYEWLINLFQSKNEKFNLLIGPSLRGYLYRWKLEDDSSNSPSTFALNQADIFGFELAHSLYLSHEISKDFELLMNFIFLNTNFEYDRRETNIDTIPENQRKFTSFNISGGTQLAMKIGIRHRL